MSILDVAGNGRILEPAGLAPAAACEAAILRAAAGDWRAALAWLQNSPQTREQWSDAARERAIARRAVVPIVQGVTAWAKNHGITAEQEYALWLHCKAEGADLTPPDEVEP